MDLHAVRLVGDGQRRDAILVVWALVLRACSVVPALAIAGLERVDYAAVGVRALWEPPRDRAAATVIGFELLDDRLPAERARDPAIPTADQAALLEEVAEEVRECPAAVCSGRIVL